MPTTHETAWEHEWRRRFELDRTENEHAPEAYVRLEAHEIGAILAVARLDVEAAVAYEISAQAVDEEPLGKMLLSFADDHRQPVEDLVLLARRGRSDVQPSGVLLSSSGVSYYGFGTYWAVDPRQSMTAMLMTQRGPSRR
jgi:hypothetical protein